MKSTIVSVLAIISIAVSVYFLWPGGRLLSANGANTPVMVQPETQLSEGNRYVFDVTLHSAEEIDSLLARAEKLAQTTRTINNESGIALVLHGPEIAFFANKNYLKYKSIVDRAARLDANGVIEIKMCQRRMQALGIEADGIPPFIEVVPFGPDEVQRLKRSGYIYL